MIKFFRIISLLEGLSYLAILSVTLGYISRDYVSSIGMTHGILFMIYMIIALSNNTNWSSRQQLGLMAAAVIPFAFIPTEIYLQKQEQKKPA
jgi:integral membrane protein